MMRAKARVSSVEAFNADGYPASEKISFTFPSKDGGYPADGSDEDQQFARWTPSATLEMTITNPSLLGSFAVGDTFYLDFTRV